MLISQMLPVIVLMIPIYYMANDLGLVDYRITVAMAHLIITLPITTWMSRSHFKGIPKGMEEAAMLDGCNTAQTL